MTKDEIQTALLNAMTQHNAYLQRLSSSAVGEILKNFNSVSNDTLNKLQSMIGDLSSAEVVALASARYTTPQLKEINSLMLAWQQSVATQLPEVFAVSGIALAAYEQAYIHQLTGAKQKEKEAKKLYNRAVSQPFAQGNLFNAVFPNISKKMRDNAEMIIRDGITTGQTTQQIIDRIKGKKILEYNDGLLATIRIDIDSAVRTARAAISSSVYSDTWTELGFGYVMDLATLDFRTSKGCAMRDHRIQKNSDTAERPPYHFRCRTVQIGCDADGYTAVDRPFVASDKPVIDIPTDQRDGVIGTVDGKTTYADWFAMQDKAHQINWLGESRYKLYIDGKYTIDRFVDPLSNKLYTLEDLKKMDAETFRSVGLR